MEISKTFQKLHDSFNESVAIRTIVVRRGTGGVTGFWVIIWVTRVRFASGVCQVSVIITWITFWFLRWIGIERVCRVNIFKWCRGACL